MRFFVNLAPAGPFPRANTFAAWPPLSRLGAFTELTAHCVGEINPDTGYFLNIKVIDDAVRASALPIIEDAFRAPADDQATPEALLPSLFAALNVSLAGRLKRLDWSLSPFLNISMESRAMTRCLIRQQFEFCASHRLHCEKFSPEENRRLFGKCNNPSFHGHNYRVEVCVHAGAGPDAAVFDRPTFESVVNAIVIERFDHKNLNVDCPEFAKLNPSVENISRICFELLKPELERVGTSLHEVTVWESTKTSCAYGLGSDQ